MSTNPANANMQVLLSPPAVQVAPPVIAPIPNPTVQIGGAPAYSGPLTFTYAPGSISCPLFTVSAVNIAPAVFTVTPAMITRTMVGNLPCIGMGDVSPPVPVAGTGGTPTTPAPVAVPTTLSILSAGQVTVFAS